MSEHINTEIPRAIEKQVETNQPPRDYQPRDTGSLLDQIKSKTDTRRAEMLAEEFKRQMIDEILKKHSSD